MPYGKKTKYTRKSYGKRKNFTSKSKGDRDMRFKQMNPYRVKPEFAPRVLYTRCKYATVSNFVTNALSTASAHTFRLNSIWDPDKSGIGTTCVGHAVLEQLYDRYLVTGAKINVRFYDPTTDAVRVGVRLRIRGGGACAGQTMTQLIEQPLTYQQGLAASGSQQSKNFSFFVRPWSLMGYSKLQYMADSNQFSAPIAGNPIADDCVFDVFAIEGTGTSRSVAYTVKIVYYVMLYDRRYLTT